MTEILTESFCERCGTRYTFESARPRARLKGVKVLSRGLKNFVLSDDNSMDEAMAAARSDTDRELTAHQLDAFHKTFNFCMSCRQYTCPNCWNEAEARCLTCAPHLGHEVLPAPFPDLVTSSYLVADPVDEVAANGTNGSNGAVHELVGDEAPATGVDTSDFAARLQALMAPPPLDEPVDEAVVEEPAEAVAEAAVAAAAIDEIVPDAIEAAAEVDQPAEVEPVAQVEVASDIPYAVEAAAVLADVEAAEEPVAAEAEPVAAEEPAEDAEIAARLAAWSAAAVVMDAARDEEPSATRRVPPRPAASSAGSVPGRTSTRSSMTTNVSRPPPRRSRTSSSPRWSPSPRPWPQPSRRWPPRLRQPRHWPPNRR